MAIFIVKLALFGSLCVFRGVFPVCFLLALAVPDTGRTVSGQSCCFELFLC